MIVADTSPIIGLGLLDRLDLLPALFGDAFVPAEVVAEAVIAARPGCLEIQRALAAGMLHVQAPLQPGRFADVLDLGESAALSLAIERGAERLVIDERRGRRVAIAHGMAVIGTLGVLRVAEGVGLLGDLDGALTRLRACGFYLPLVAR